jgi:hypothetical protein
MQLRSALYAAVACFLVNSAPVDAQTVANGPYYATPAWDQTLPSNTRFIVLANMNQEAVLDRETGLVWERQPTTELLDYTPALFRCRLLVKGNRQGWRMPTQEEIRTLVSIGVIDGFTDQLPPGHPFILQPARTYWTSTGVYHDPTIITMMRFQRPDTTPGFTRDAGNLESVWCVRAQGVSP